MCRETHASVGNTRECDVWSTSGHMRLRLCHEPIDDIES